MIASSVPFLKHAEPFAIFHILSLGSASSIFHPNGPTAERGGSVLFRPPSSDQLKQPARMSESFFHHQCPTGIPASTLQPQRFALHLELTHAILVPLAVTKEAAARYEFIYNEDVTKGRNNGLRTTFTSTSSKLPRGGNSCRSILYKIEQN